MFSLTPWKRQKNGGALTRREDPFRLMQHEFQHLFDRFFGDWPLAAAEGLDVAPGWGLDVEDKENEVFVRAELPGFDVNDLDVQLTENLLTIEAQHKEEEGKENGARHYSHVRRSVTVPSGLDVEKISATFKNGVLELHLPRLPEAKGRKIEIAG